MIADLVAARGIAVATFADLFGTKVEQYDASVHSPRILRAAGVRTAIKTDHPVIDGSRLMFETAKTTMYGVEPAAALAAVTSVPAAVLELDHRLGSLVAGLDADLVLWDRFPLVPGARVNGVWVEGTRVVENDYGDSPATQGPTDFADPPPGRLGGCPLGSDGGPIAGGDAHVFTSAMVYTNLHDGPPHLENVVVEDGVVTCIGNECAFFFFFLFLCLCVCV